MDGLVQALEHDWSVEVGQTLDGGTAAFVATAVTAGGRPAVIKIAMPAEADGVAALVDEVRLLLLADGRGCVRVLRHDLQRGAVLLERLGRQLATAALPAPQSMAIICAVLREVWAIPPAEPRLARLADKGRALAETIGAVWEALDEPCPRRVVETAWTYAERRLSRLRPPDDTLLHGDAHVWNTLEDVTSGDGQGYRFVDPDGLIGEPEYDLAILMREFSEELLSGDALVLGRARAAFLADHTHLRLQRIWEWGYLERAANALLSERDAPGSARDLLEIVDQWSRFTG